MSKFKVGDKVVTPIGVGIVDSEEKFDIDLDEWHIEVVIGERFGFSRVITFEVNDLKPYRTAHEKLIEMGYTHEQLGEDLTDDYYGKDAFDYIWFSRTEKNYTLGDHVYVDLELSRILTQYLEELEEWN